MLVHIASLPGKESTYARRFYGPLGGGIMKSYIHGNHDFFLEYAFCPVVVQD